MLLPLAYSLLVLCIDCLSHRVAEVNLSGIIMPEGNGQEQAINLQKEAFAKRVVAIYKERH